LYFLLFVVTIFIQRDVHANDTMHESFKHDFGNNNPYVYVCFGDSITVGYNVKHNETYPAKLQELLGKTVINEGISGSTSYYGALRVGSVLQKHKPGYLLTLYGVNDIGGRTNTDIINSLREIIQTAKNNQTIPVIATLTPVFGQRAWKAPHVRNLNENIRILAKEENILLVDLENAFNWNEKLIDSNGIHPNPLGYELIAKTFYNALEDSSTGSGGGGCTIKDNGEMGYEWFFLFTLLFIKVAWNAYRNKQYNL
jgi:lysophospholipase L1-like esterase